MNNSREKIHIEEIIVVEGRDDTSAVLAAVDGITIETHGYGIRKETWDILDKAYETKGLIIFTDPDPAGERIRRRLAERFPDAAHAFLDRDDAISGDDIGIENSAPEAIQAALQKAHEPCYGEKSGSAGSEYDLEGDLDESNGDCTDEGRGEVAGQPLITVADMDRWGLAGGSDSSYLRRALGKELGLGFASAKTFLKRLNRFGITHREVEEALKRIFTEQ